MKIHSVILVAGVLAAAIPAVAQQGAQMPAACRPDKTGEVNQRACADALPVGSPERVLPLINLGAEAFLNRNFGEAVRLLDEAIPPGKTHRVRRALPRIPRRRLFPRWTGRRGVQGR
jgi:hypothetical protein